MNVRAFHPDVPACLDVDLSRAVDRDVRALDDNLATALQRDRRAPAFDYDLVRRRDEARAAEAAPSAPETPKPPKPHARRQRPARPRASELDRVEASIAAAEERVAELERRLADDWTNVDTLATHRAARDELQALLQRWEQLFESAQA